MIDTEVFFSVTWTGAGFGVFAATLYLLTSEGEPCGFRVFPASVREWVGYWFRTLELTLLACILLGWCRVVTELVAIAFVASFFLLLASSIVFWRSDRGLSVSGVWFLILAALSVLMYPAVPGVRERRWSTHAIPMRRTSAVQRTATPSRRLLPQTFRAAAAPCSAVADLFPLGH